MDTGVRLSRSVLVCPGLSWSLNPCRDESLPPDRSVSHDSVVVCGLGVFSWTWTWSPDRLRWKPNDAAPTFPEFTWIILWTAVMYMLFFLFYSLAETQPGTCWSCFRSQSFLCLSLTSEQTLGAWSWTEACRQVFKCSFFLTLVHVKWSETPTSTGPKKTLHTLIPMIETELEMINYNSFIQSQTSRSLLLLSSSSLSLWLQAENRKVFWNQNF